MNSRMIFHYPKPIIGDGSSGTSVRPGLMLSAFKNIGFEVDVIGGFRHERKEAINRIMKNAVKGDYAFAYAESTTKTALLVERVNSSADINSRVQFAIWVLQGGGAMDYKFFMWLRRYAIPLGLFYRDVHWRYEHYMIGSSRLKKAYHSLLFRNEWRNYQRSVDHLFVPTIEMQDILPSSWDRGSMSPLPPGCIPSNSSRTKSEQGSSVLNLFYVGGIMPPIYDLRNAFKLISELDDVTWTVCCREKEWMQFKYQYIPYNQNSIIIVHAKGKKLARFYEQSDLFFLYWRSYDYWQHTISIKIIESIGYLLPIVTSAGTVAANFVEEQDIGWVVENDEELIKLLDHLRRNRNDIELKRKNMKAIQKKHTWEERAREAAEVLMNLETGQS